MARTPLLTTSVAKAASNAVSFFIPTNLSRRSAGSRGAGMGLTLVMNELRRIALVALICLLPGAGSSPTVGAADAPILAVMQSELQRNFQALSKEPSPAYFISYTVHDERTTYLSASFGALQQSSENRGRAATVEVRVGEYFLDNTHPIRGDVSAMSPRVRRIALPLTDDEQPIRQALWLGTDRAFKQAAQALTRVRTNVAAKIQEEDPAADFSREQPETYTSDPVSYTLDTKLWETRLRRISALFDNDPRILRNDVSLTVGADNRYYTNSEGSRIADGAASARLFIQAMTKADDGMELPLYSSYFASSPDGLPSEQQLLADTREMVAMLGRLRTAPVVDPFSGPAILSGRAAGVFFHEIFGHRVEGHRQKNTNDAQTFGKRVNQAVLPAFLNVAFDPTLQKRGNTELMGHYVYDDEGVKSRRVNVVEQGVLKTFLLGRAALRAFPQSNGHGRAEQGFVPVSRQSNLVVESSQSVSADNLMNMLREEARKQGKPFGLLFENIEGGFTTTTRGAANAFNVLPNVVYRIYTDGRTPELVRGVDLIGTPLAAFAKIVAASDKVDVFNGVCGAESGGVPVSASSPALLISEVEVQKKAQSQETLPILPGPPRAGRS